MIYYRDIEGFAWFLRRRKRLIKKIVILCMTIMMLTACTKSTESTDEGKYKALYEELLAKQPPTIERMTIEDGTGNMIVQDESGWFAISNNAKMIAKVNGTATEAEVYFVPSGSETSKYQQLIASDVVDGDQVQFTFTTDQFTDGLGYLWMVIYNNEIGRKSEEIRVSILEE